jgi:hypothetical protein
LARRIPWGQGLVTGRRGGKKLGGSKKITCERFSPFPPVGDVNDIFTKTDYNFTPFLYTS